MEYVRYCIKCDMGSSCDCGFSDKITTRWTPDQGPKKLKNGVEIEPPVEEHLDCRCQACGYEWKSLTMEQYLKEQDSRIDEVLIKNYK